MRRVQPTLIGSLEKPPIFFNSPLLETLQPAECDRSVWALELRTRSRNSLGRLGIFSVGQLVQSAQQGIMPPRAAGRQVVADVESSLRALSRSIRQDGYIDWDRYFDNRPDFGANSKASAAKNIPLSPVGVHISSRSLSSLMPICRESCLDILHTGPRASTCLKRIGVRSVGDLVDLARRGITDMRAAGPATIAEINAALRGLSRSIGNDGSVDWITYAAERGFLVLPEEDSVEIVPRHFLKIFPAVMERAVESRYRFSETFVLRHYLLGDSQKPTSLDKVGRKLGRTKQAIALLKDKVVRMLRNAILRDSYGGCRFRFRDAFVTPMRQLSAALSVAKCRPILYSDWTRILSETWGVTSAEFGGLESFLLSFFDFNIVQPRGSRFRPIVLPKSINTSLFNAALPATERLLRTRWRSGLSEEELLAKLHSSVGDLTAKEIPIIINSISGVEHIEPEGRFRLRIERVSLLADQLERLLQEKRLPMHIRELTTRVGKSKLKSGGVRTVKNISASLSHHERFKPLARSGYWILSCWNGFETRTVADIVAEILRGAKRSMTEAELYPLIVAQRPVRPDSIRNLLYQDHRFQRVAPCTWELK